jgi:death-on-curing protein
MTTRHVTVEEVIAYHDALFHADGKAPAPLLQFGKLESGVLRPQATAFQQDAYATLAEKAAALLQGVSIAHPFFDGNKRAALGAALLFMELNGVKSIADQDALYYLVIEVTTGRLREVDEIAPRLKELFAPDLDGD